MNLNLTYRVFDFLRFPLMLGVVAIHSVILDSIEAIQQNFVCCAIIETLFSRILSTPCVPLFFFISAFLLFRHSQQQYSMSDYLQVLKKRGRTLLIPYLFWNLAVIACYAFMHAVTPSMINPEDHNVLLYNLGDWIAAFWDQPGGQPICFQFWFLRDLMILILCSPLVYLLAKKMKYALAVLLVCLYVYNTSLFPHQGPITFFSLGAVCSINGIDFVTFCRKLLLLFLPLFIVTVMLRLYAADAFPILLSGSCLLGMLSYTGIAVFLVEKGHHMPNYLSSGSFFLYATHAIPLLVLATAVKRLYPPHSDIGWCTAYISCGSFIVLSIYCVYILLRKICPKALAIVTGGR